MDKNDIRKWISENEQDLFCDPEEPKYIPSPVVEDFIDESLSELSNREQRNLLKELSSEIDSRLQDVGEEKDDKDEFEEE